MTKLTSHRVVELRNQIRLVYLFTTFPKLTETFLQREVLALQRLPVDLELFSLWGGHTQFEGSKIYRFPKWRLVTLIWWLPYWLVHKPDAFASTLRSFRGRPVQSWKNLGETLLGISFALIHAARLACPNRRPDLLHAAWATMPATAAQLVTKLTGIPFTMGAHAYDVYQGGGDWLLPAKLQEAARIVTSTSMAREELLRRGADPDRVFVVRRGLYPFPELTPVRQKRDPLHVLYVGRLVEKKGLLDLLEILSHLKSKDIDFQAHVIGDGPLAQIARAQVDQLELTRWVDFLGAMAFGDVLDQFAWADLLMFTGTVATDGDRDGMPNVILEAMATGTPVVARQSNAITELLRDGENATLLAGLDLEEWTQALIRLRDDDVHYGRIRQAARATVESHCNALSNTETFLLHLGAACVR